MNSSQTSCQWLSTSGVNGPSRYPMAKSDSLTITSGIHGDTYGAGAAQLDSFEYSPSVVVRYSSETSFCGGW